ncbi:collagen-like protein [Aquimarina brevivitae]|uniref:Uncharacterized protein n=1 Tax=Aquimarina brevivitae TaxID=323412 RepID=A0A4Q7P1P1_9FLAO|nr:collagen-like protein [Aquimarina brevivitae]RZS93773.1 hypothetical protein EV197_2354 [Aquimarina brevivitae]
MKRIFSILFLATVLFMSCEGPQGPPGPPGFDGQDGQDGGVFLAQTFEVDNVDFISDNGFDAFVNIPVPNTIDVFESDVALAYILDPVASDANGADVWEPMPRVFFFADGGYAQYRYNFIFDDATGIFDLEIILESDDFASLPASFTDNQILRIVIVPSEFAQTNDVSDLDKVMAKLNLSTSDFIDLEL